MQSDIGKIITTVGIVAITTSCIVATGGAAATVLVPSAIGAIAGGTSSYLMGGDVLDGICLGALMVVFLLVLAELLICILEIFGWNDWKC